MIELSLPNSETAAFAASALRSLPAVKNKSDKVVLRIEPNSTKIPVPYAAFELFVRVLSEMANGNAVTILPVHAELSTQQAADLLNVSRPYLIKLLDEGKIPFQRVGNRRRIMFAELLRYKRSEDAKRQQIFEELAIEAQKLGLDY